MGPNRSLAEGGGPVRSTSAQARANPRPTNGTEDGVLLGYGAFGEMYAAHLDGVSDACTVEVVRPEWASSTELVRRLFAEAPAAQRLTHRVAAVVRDAFRGADDSILIVSPLLSGQTLEVLVDVARREASTLPAPWVFHIGAELADALKAAHALSWFPGAPTPMVHGALSPSMVLVTFEGDVRLSGLGVGRARWALPCRARNLAYIPPERWLLQPPRPESDVHGLGALLFEALTGVSAFARSCEHETREAILAGTCPSLHGTGKAGLGDGFDLVLELLAPRPESRPSDLGAVGEAFRRAAGVPPSDLREALAAHLHDRFSEARRQRNELRASFRIGPSLPDQPARPLENVGRYRLEGEIPGQGPRAIYRGCDPELGRTVCIHVMDPNRIADDRLTPDAWVRQFELEARYAARLDHPQLPLLLDAGVQGPLRYLVYRWAGGCTLSDWLDQHGPLSADNVVRLGAGWAAALHALHRAELIHGDIRAVNLTLQIDGEGRPQEPALGGLGWTHPSRGPAHPLGPTHLLVQAPETLGGDPYDSCAEQFAFGSVLYQSLVGTRPFRGLVDEELMAAIRVAEYRSASQMGVVSVPHLDEALRRMLSPRREERFRDFCEISSFLDAGELRP